MTVLVTFAIYIKKRFSSIYVPEFEENKFKFRIISLIKSSFKYLASTLSFLRIGNEPSNFRKLIEIASRASIVPKTSNVKVKSVITFHLFGENK